MMKCPFCSNVIESVDKVSIRALVYESIGESGEPINMDYPVISDAGDTIYRCPVCDHEETSIGEYVVNGRDEE